MASSDETGGPSESEGSVRFSRGVRNAAVTAGSMNRTLHGLGRGGLPHWATATLLSTWLFCAALAIAGYLAAHSWVVVWIFGGIAFTVTVGVANATSLMRAGATGGSGRPRPR